MNKKCTFHNSAERIKHMQKEINTLKQRIVNLNAHIQAIHTAFTSLTVLNSSDNASMNNKFENTSCGKEKEASSNCDNTCGKEKESSSNYYNTDSEYYNSNSCVSACSFRNENSYEDRNISSMSNEECSICLEVMNPIINGKQLVTTDCNHKFHSVCLLKNAINFKNSSCPLCRHDITKHKKSIKMKYGKSILELFKDKSWWLFGGHGGSNRRNCSINNTYIIGPNNTLKKYINTYCKNCRHGKYHVNKCVEKLTYLKLSPDVSLIAIWYNNFKCNKCNCRFHWDINIPRITSPPDL